ncbi:permease, partial [Micromonospora sp. NPDC047738]
MSPAPAATPVPPRRDRTIGSVEVLCVLLILVGVLHRQVGGLFADPRLQTWLTVFVSVLVQAVPFLVFGVVLSAVIAVFVPRSFWARALP